MSIRIPRSIAFIILVSLIQAVLLIGPGLAQSSAQLDELSIALWPEYDRPGLLVIFRGRVAENISLPASLSFDLPSDVQEMNAVAYLDEAQDTLLNIPEYEILNTSGGKALSFAIPSREFQFEYYSRALLNVEGDNRQLTFSFAPGADVESLTFEIQQPIATEGFASNPAPTASEVRDDGLLYVLYEMGPAAAGKTYSLRASYTRSTDGLSADALGGVSSPSSVQPPVVETSDGSLEGRLGPILISVGVLLLVGAFGYGWWSQRRQDEPESAAGRWWPRAREVSRRPSHQKEEPSASGDSLPAYCPRCGAKFREDASFCHNCGAPRRGGA